MITIKKLFIYFLKQNNAYEQYMFNFISNNPQKINFIKFLNDTNEIHYIIHKSFPWHKTKEGIQKWSELSKKWTNQIYWTRIRNK